MHFAGLKSVNESVSMPLVYYNSHINGTIALLEVMKEFKVKRLIFSSSATVYGPPQELPVTHAHEVGSGITNPYGRTKFIIEEMLRDLAASDESWKIIMLRFFNDKMCKNILFIFVLVATSNDGETSPQSDCRLIN